MNETNPTDAHARTNGQVLIDVREPDEWNDGHAPDAVHIPLGNLAGADLPDAEEFLCICRSGGRSSKAVDILTTAGHTATNVTGGMTAWAEHGLPIITESGATGTVK